MMQVRPVGEKAPDVLRRCLPFLQERPDRRSSSARVSGSKVGSDPHEPRSRRHKRARQHAVESFDPNLTKEPTSASCARPSASFASVLFAAISSAALACRASMQIAGKPSALRA